MTEKSFLRIFSYFGNENSNRILQDINNHGSNFLRKLSANETNPVVKKDCSTFSEFLEDFIRPVSDIGLAFRGQASAAWPLNSSLFRLWARLKMPDNCGTSRKIGRFISLSQELAKNHLKPNWQNVLPDDDYLMAVLQHYNRMSPLLDWTLNMDYALYFAFADAPADNSENVTIYIADIGKVNNLELHMINKENMNYRFNTMLDITLDAVKQTGGWAFVRPAHFGDIRFAIQEAIFTYQNAADLELYLSTYNSWSGTDFVTPGTLWKVTLPLSERPKFMKYLEINNITHETLFAGWDEISREIVSKYADEIIKDPSGIPHATVEQIKELQSRK